MDAPGHIANIYDSCRKAEDRKASVLNIVSKHDHPQKTKHKRGGVRAHVLGSSSGRLGGFEPADLPNRDPNGHLHRTKMNNGIQAAREPCPPTHPSCRKQASDVKKMVRQPRTSSPTVDDHQFRRTCGATRDGNVNVNTPQHGMW